MRDQKGRFGEFFEAYDTSEEFLITVITFCSLRSALELEDTAHRAREESQPYERSCELPDNFSSRLLRDVQGTRCVSPGRECVHRF